MSTLGSQPLNPVEAARLEGAKKLTFEQYRAAQQVSLALGLGNNPPNLGEILQALATNYLAVVQANRD